MRQRHYTLARRKVKAAAKAWTHAIHSPPLIRLKMSRLKKEEN